jgi:tetratricopeptide (TPR) repeat protein
MRVLSHRRPAERRVWDMLRQRKWKNVLAELEKIAQVEERNYAIWNAVGDAHFRCKSAREAVAAWRRAAEGYVQEGLHENALALTKKTLRLVPEETELHLTLAELYLTLGYDADSLASLRTYLRLCSRRSELDLRSFFRKVIEGNLQHLHLLEELVPLFREAGIEDQELGTELEKFIVSRKKAVVEVAPREETAFEEAVSSKEESAYRGGSADGLMTLGTAGAGVSNAEESALASSSQVPGQGASERGSATRASWETTRDETLPTGEGRDHYDLGMVYLEMKLWDAALDEFEQARRDESLSFRAGLALAECLLAKGDPRQALELLEKFEGEETQPDEERLRFELVKGEIHEALGNLTQALSHFENIHERQQSFGNVEERIRHLKERMTE